MSIREGRTSRGNRTATLKVGDEAPDFELPGHRKQEKVRLRAFRGRNVVVVFYPLDWTGV